MSIGIPDVVNDHIKCTEIQFGSSVEPVQSFYKLAICNNSFLTQATNDSLFTTNLQICRNISTNRSEYARGILIYLLDLSGKLVMISICQCVKYLLYLIQTASILASPYLIILAAYHLFRQIKSLVTHISFMLMTSLLLPLITVIPVMAFVLCHS